MSVLSGTSGYRTLEQRLTFWGDIGGSLKDQEIRENRSAMITVVSRKEL